MQYKIALIVSGINRAGQTKPQKPHTQMNYSLNIYNQAYLCFKDMTRSDF
jgi:hypothetical protein